MRASLRTFIAAGAVWFCIGGLVPAAASAFGAVNTLGQRAEHERITRLALGCRPGQPNDDGSCFQPKSLYNVAGGSGFFGAVGAPDNLPLHLSGGPPFWHCDDADYLDVPGYPQSRADATKALDRCRTWAREMLMDGPPGGPFPGLTWPSWGATRVASGILNSRGNVDVSDPGTDYFSSCFFDGKLGRVKCTVWEPLGYALHTAEDFYSHGNWADLPDPNQPIGIANPPGLGMRTLPSYWDLRQPSVPIPDPRLATGCYGSCNGRITHSDTLNKDKEDINLTTGLVTDPTTPRGKIGDNAQRAVNDAVAEARRVWAEFRFFLVLRYGPVGGGKRICALSSDSADKQCNDATRAEKVFAEVPAAPVTVAATADGAIGARQCLDAPGEVDGTLLIMSNCNGSANQQFRFKSRQVKYTSTGTGPLVVLGKCLEASTNRAPRIQIQRCDGSAAQQVTVTAAAQLQVGGMCFRVRGDAPGVGPVFLGPCGDAGDNGIWQFR